MKVTEDSLGGVTKPKKTY